MLSESTCDDGNPGTLFRGFSFQAAEVLLKASSVSGSSTYYIVLRYLSLPKKSYVQPFTHHHKLSRDNPRLLLASVSKFTSLTVYLPHKSPSTSSYISTITSKMVNKPKASGPRRARVIKPKKNCYIRSLPSELVTAVCKDLSRKDLVSARRVSKAFEQAASPILFRSIWFSVEPRDWDTIRQISEAQDSVVRNYVREICYDNTRYEKELCKRKVQVDALLTTGNSKAAILRGYKLYNNLYDQELDPRYFHTNELLDRPGSFLADALTEARETRDTSKLAPYLSEDLVCLAQAFMLLPNVDTFSLSNSRWYNDDHRWTTVQISRSTTKNRSYCTIPHRLPGHEIVLFDPVPAQATADGVDGVQRGFRIFLQAASISQMKNLRFFNLGPVVPNNCSAQLTFLDFGMFPIQMKMARHAFCGLTNLDLRFVAHGIEHLRPEFDEEQAILQSGKIGRVLHHAANLTTLAIEFGNLSRIENLSWMLGPGAWNSLRRVTLGFMDVHARQLVDFLLLHSSSLQYLCLEDLVFREEDVTNLATSPWSQFFQAIIALDLAELSLARLGKNTADLECPIWHSKDRAGVQSFLHSGGSALFVLASTEVTDSDEEDVVEEEEWEFETESEDMPTWMKKKRLVTKTPAV